MKKTKKIPYTPKYKFGGFEKTIFTPDADDKKKMKKFGKQAGTAAYGVGEGVLDVATMGATDQLTDKGYTALQKAGNSTEDEMREQNSIRGFGNAAGAIGGAFINPSATSAAIGQVGKGLGAGVSEGNKSKGWAQDAGMALNTAGKVGSMAYGMSGSPMTSGMEAQAGNFNSSSFGQGLGKYNEFMGQGNTASGINGANSPLGIMNMLGGMGGMGEGAEMKYGGYMKYAMGGMNKYPGGGMGEGTGQVELQENSIAPNGQFTQFDEPSHDAQNPNIPNASLAPGEKVFSDKLKAPGTNKTFAKLNASNNTNIEDKLESKEYLDPKTETSIYLRRMAKKKNSDMLFAIQEQLKKDKVAAYAKRMGVELPSMDNEQMEPQGQSEQSEGEAPMARYGGMYGSGGIHINPANKGKFTASAQHAGMGTQEFANHVLANKEDYSSTQVKRANFAHNAAGWKHEMGGMQEYAMGGVQLPYYNINRNGTNKYAMGGMEEDPAMPTANTGTVVPTMSTPPQFGNRSDWENYYIPKGWAKDPRNKSGVNVNLYDTNKYKYNQETDSFKFANNEPVPFNRLLSSDLMEFKPGSGVQKVVNKKSPVGTQSLNKWDFNSGTPTKKYYNESGELLKSEEYDNAGPSGKVLNTIEPRRKLAYGGMMPKYALGGEEEDDNGFGYTPNNPAEAYRMQQASKMNNRIYSQKSSYAPSVLPWEKTNDSGNTPNNPYTFPVQEENPDIVNRRNDRLAREAAEIAGTGSEGTTDTTGTGGSNKYNNRDKMLQGIGMAASIAPELDYLKNKGKRYDTQKLYEYNPNLMDPTETIKGIKYAGKQSQENINIGSMGSGATLLANAAAQRNKTSADIAKATKDYDNANVAIINRGKEYNIGNRYAVDDINARNKEGVSNAYYKTLDSAGKKVNQGTKDIRSENQDNQMMAMIPKMMNSPEFKKFFEEYQKGSSKTTYST